MRLRVPDEGVTVVRDVIRGESEFQNDLQDDLVIARADGTPVYQLAVVVDDLDSGITHVVRGTDHYSNTPKQMLILEALGEQAPVYAHVPLLHGPDGKKLSKRHGAASVQELRDRGYLPEAVRNYLALLGWGMAGGDDTFFTTEQLQREFALERVSRSPAIFDEQKLRWMNGRYVRELGGRRAAGPPRGAATRASCAATWSRSPRRRSRRSTSSGRCRASSSTARPTTRPRARRCSAPTARSTSCARRARRWSRSRTWDPGSIETALREVVDREGVKPKHVFQPVRVALAGATVSPGIFETVAVMGRDETLARIDAVARWEPGLKRCLNPGSPGADRRSGACG